MDQSRRRFLGLFRVPADARRSASSAEVSGSARSQKLGPVIDANLCYGCDACAAVCDDGAIVLDHSGGELAYLVRAVACTACAACVAVCDADAVSLIASDAAARPVRVELQAVRCQTCRNVFHRSTQRGDLMEVCPICARRHQSLRQSRS